MKTNQKIFIVIPAYNESSVIGSVIKEIKINGYRDIIIVDDGSTDHTANIAKRQGTMTIRHILNRGKGAAAKTGIEAAKILKADIVVTMDGDGQHNPKDIKRIVEAINKGDQIVLGNRLHRGNKVPAIRVIANYFGNFFTWFIYGLWVKDSQSGFRAYSKKALKMLNTNYDKYEFDSEIIREIAKNNLKYSEIPIEVRYTEYALNKRHRQTFINGIKTMIRLVLSI